MFLYAAWDKVLHPADFARIVYHYQVIGPGKSLPPLLPNLLAVALPWVEIVVGACLVTGAWRREAAVLAAALLGVFVVAVASALLRGIDIQNCGCFSVGAEGRRAGALLILGDLALMAAALVLAAGPRPAPAPAPLVDKAREPA